MFFIEGKCIGCVVVIFRLKEFWFDNYNYQWLTASFDLLKAFQTFG